MYYCERDWRGRNGSQQVCDGTPVKPGRGERPWESDFSSGDFPDISVICIFPAYGLSPRLALISVLH